ncbi:MAG: hypothetical protein MRY64_13205 [Hyphomonadaceae bacterium]|nr:hypothetical protein [Hyphomonadaceae bacterium]
MRTVWLISIMAGLAVACSNEASAPTAATAAEASSARATPLIIAHRGASGLYPEHTLEAYGAAIDMGADFIEPDLVMTKDGVLVARHDRYLSTSTDVADHPEFADRRVIKQVGGSPMEDWFVEDFTLSELKSLRARQAFTGRSAEYDDEFAIPTLTEILGLVAISNSPEQTVGVYPELKSPDVFTGLGMDMETALLEAIDAVGLKETGAPVYIQSFNPDTLRSLNAKTDWPLVQLLPASTGERLSPDQIATYADGIGPWKQVMVLFRGGPLAYVELAHNAGLEVHPYTYRADDIAPGFETFQAELEATFALGVDAIFTDHPNQALAVRDGQ